MRDPRGDQMEGDMTTWQISYVRRPAERDAPGCRSAIGRTDAWWWFKSHQSFRPMKLGGRYAPQRGGGQNHPGGTRSGLVGMAGL